MSIHYDSAETLIYDPVGPNRNATRTNLHALGFRKVEPAPTLEMLEKQIKMRAPDLLMCEAAGAEAELCTMIQAVRQGKIGDNPFIVIVVTTWRRDGDLVVQVLNSGADDLLARPFSTVQLGERLRAHIERRKSFVVTSDYIGPDRRRDATRASAECFDVPNTLRMRTVDVANSEDVERAAALAVRQGKIQVSREKLRRDAFQLCVQWRRFEQRRPDAPDFTSILDRLEEIAAEIDIRAESLGITESRQWCKAITESARSIGYLLECGDREDQVKDRIGLDLGAPLHLLGHAALTLGQIFAPGEVRPGQLVELDAIVARADVRQGGLSPVRQSQPSLPPVLERRAVANSQGAR